MVPPLHIWHQNMKTCLYLQVYNENPTEVGVHGGGGYQIYKYIFVYYSVAGAMSYNQVWKLGPGGSQKSSLSSLARSISATTTPQAGIRWALRAGPVCSDREICVNPDRVLHQLVQFHFKSIAERSYDIWVHCQHYLVTLSLVCIWVKFSCVPDPNPMEEV